MTLRVFAAVLMSIAVTACATQQQSGNRPVSLTVTKNMPANSLSPAANR